MHQLFLDLKFSVVVCTNDTSPRFRHVLSTPRRRTPVPFVKGVKMVVHKFTDLSKRTHVSVVVRCRKNRAEV
jgi:hypothetical protein